MAAVTRHRNRACLRASRTVLLVLLLFVSSLALSAAHRILTPHRMCEVHGTLEHDTLAAQEAAPESAPTGPVYRSQGRTHEECELGPCLRSEAVQLHEARLVSVSSRCESPAVLPAEVLAEEARFRLAPSRSPPA